MIETMTRVSINQAADMAGIGRNTFYQRHLNEGCPQPLTTDNQGKKGRFIEISELLRYYPNIKLTDNQDNIQNVTQGQVMTFDKDNENKAIQAELKAAREMIELLKDQLEKAEARESKHMDVIAQQTRLLEHKQAQPAPKRRGWWPFRKGS